MTLGILKLIGTKSYLSLSMFTRLEEVVLLHDIALAVTSHPPHASYGNTPKRPLAPHAHTHFQI